MATPSKPTIKIKLKLNSNLHQPSNTASTPSDIQSTPKQPPPSSRASTSAASTSSKPPKKKGITLKTSATPSFSSSATPSTSTPGPSTTKKAKKSAATAKATPSSTPSSISHAPTPQSILQSVYNDHVSSSTAAVTAPIATTSTPSSLSITLQRPQPLPSPPPPPPPPKRMGPKVTVGAGGRTLVSGQAQKPLKEVCDKMLKEVLRRDEYGFFLNPVTEEDVPGYRQVISNPMDLTTIGNKLEAGQYRDFKSFSDDMLLIFSNCMEFNPPETPFHQVAVRLKDWVNRHIPLSSALVLPEDLAAPTSVAEPALPPLSSFQSSRAPSNAPAARSPSVDQSTRETSAFSESAAPSPQTSTSASTPSHPVADTRIRTNIGKNQLGKKRGPYNKTKNKLLSNGTVAGQDTLTALPVAASTSSSSSKAVEIEPNTDDGSVKGSSMLAYEEAFWGLVSWWEHGGRRPKTKKEIQKLVNHPERTFTYPDGSSNLGELETLTPLLDNFLYRPPAQPKILVLPPNFLHTFSSIVASSSALPPLPPPKPHRPTYLAPAPAPVYPPMHGDALLPEAFSWRTPRTLPPGSGSLFPRPPENDKAPSAASRPNIIKPELTGIDDPVPPLATARSMIAHDFGVYSSLHPSSSTVPALEHILLDSIRNPPFAPTYFNTARTVDPFVTPLTDQNLEMFRSHREESYLKDLMYGGNLGEAYARSIERFVGGYGGEEDVGGGGEGAEGKSMLKEWVEESVVGGVFGAGAIRTLRKIAEGLDAVGGVRSHPIGQLDLPPSSSKQEAGGPDVMDVDGGQARALGVIKVESEFTPIDIPTHLLRRIAALPKQRQSECYLSSVRNSSISLASLLKKPEDFFVPAPELSPPEDDDESNLEDQSDDREMNGERIRSSSVKKRKKEELVTMGWPGNVLVAIGEELAAVAERAKESDGVLPSSEKKKRAKMEDGSGMDTDVVEEEEEDEKLKRIRFLLLSLTKHVVHAELEKMTPAQLNLLPLGFVRSHYERALGRPPLPPPGTGGAPPVGMGMASIQGQQGGLSR